MARDSVLPTSVKFADVDAAFGAVMTGALGVAVSVGLGVAVTVGVGVGFGVPPVFDSPQPSEIVEGVTVPLDGLAIGTRGGTVKQPVSQ